MTKLIKRAEEIARSAQHQRIDRVTRQLKAMFGSAAVEATEAAIDSVESAVGTFVRSVYTRSSVSTHTATGRDEVIGVRDFVRVALCELLEIRNA